MDKIEMYLAAIGTVIGIAIGVMITNSFRNECISCQQLKQENKMLMDMIMRQQETIIIQDSAIPDSIQWYEQ
jgi:uncharacterized membrane-anchored protein YhcB (DUF1043 family)